MSDFPRTTVGGVSLSRLIIGTNWFLGYSHTSAAKDKFIKNFQTRDNVADIITTFMKAGVDTSMGMPVPLLRDAIKIAEDRTGREVIDLSLDFIHRRLPDNELQKTRSKKSLTD